jgi:hypothetical protein
MELETSVGVQRMSLAAKKPPTSFDQEASYQALEETWLRTLCARERQPE